MRSIFQYLVQKLADIQSFRRRIAINIIVLGVLVFISVYFLLGRKTRVAQYNEIIAFTYQPAKSYAFACFQAINQMISILQNSVYAAEKRISSRTNEEILELWEKKALVYNDSLQKLIKTREKEPELLVTYEAINDRLNKLDKLVKEAITINKKGRRVPLYHLDKLDFIDSTSIKTNKAVTFYDDALAFLLANEITRLQKELDVYFSQFLSFNNKAIEKFREEVEEENKLFTFFQVIVLLITTFVTISLIVSLNKHFSQNLEKIEIQTEQLAKGNLPNPIYTEIAEFIPITENLNTLTKNLQKLRKYAISVAEGKFDTEIQVFDEKSDFGKAILQMQEGLLKVSKEEYIRTWRNTGIAKFSEILRQEINKLREAFPRLISELVKYVGANQGGIFIVNDNDPKNPYLELVAAYAYNKQKFLQKQIFKGQGLVGRVWQEGLPIYLREVPENYIEIRTGLGGANPRYIYIVPLKINEEVQGAIELASFHDFETYKQEFIQQIADSIASTFTATQASRRNEQLLKEAQEKNILLQEKEEELKQNIEELKATQEEMQHKQREISEREGNMRALLDNTSDAIMAFDYKKRITVINKAMKNLYESIGIYLDVGSPLNEAFPGRTYEQMEEEIKRVLAGERFQTDASVTIRGTTYYYDILYNPIYNERHRVIGASVFITDVTQQRTAELELKMKEANLQSLINNTEDSIMAIDKNYRLLVFNEVFRKRRKEFNFKEGDSVFNIIPEELHEEWKRYYDRALAGERFEKVIKRDLGNKKIQYREHSFNPIYNEKGEVIGVSVFARDITEAKLAEAENQRIMASLFEKQKQDKKRIEELEKQLKELQELLETKTS